MNERTNRHMRKIAILALFLALLALLAACGGEKTPQVIVVTATPIPEQQVVVVTVTPSPVVIVVTATPSPEPVIVVTATPSQPSLSPEEIATAQAILTAQAANLTATAMATPTDTPAPPTDTPVPTVKPTAKPTKPAPTAPPASLAPPVLQSPSEDFSCFNAQGCNFTWSWGNSLAANQYFQVQLVGPGKEHRGIHPPTKGYSFQSSWSVYQIIRDWCDPSKMCHMQWTVAIIEWDGVDPSKIGRTLIEAAPRWVWL
jgi:hypothetical protein